MPALTAPPESVPARRAGDPSLRECARVFARQPSPPYLFGALALALAARAVQGQFGWRDLVMVAGLIAVTPFVEWAIHVYLLHARPFTLLGRGMEILSAREHRAHHEAPGVLAGVLIPVYAVLVFLAMIATVNWALSFPIHAVLGGPRYWFGVTSTVGDRVIGTSPDQRSVPRSETARSLHAER